MDDLFAAALIAQWGNEWRHFVYKTALPTLDDYDTDAVVNLPSRFSYENVGPVEYEDDFNDCNW